MILNVKGWPRGWTQESKGMRLIITSPKKYGMSWTFAIDSYPGIRNGVTVKWFWDELTLSHLKQTRNYVEALIALGVK